MIRNVLVAALTAGALFLLHVLPVTPAHLWSSPPASASDCAVSPTIGASQPPNGLITAAFNAAGFNGLFPGHQYFGLTALETGPPQARSLRQPYVPPTLLKAIGWIEASWRQADGGTPVISFDCGYGITQITSPGVFPLAGVGMVYRSPDPSIYEGAQVPIATSYTHNIAFGAKTLIAKWNLAAEWRPVVGNGDPSLLEDWYYAVWSYNGFSSKNDPNSYDALRGNYSCNLSDGFNHNRTQFPYQELVLGCVKHPPAANGVELWPPIPVTLPASVPPFNWDSPQTMNIPTPQPAHGDPTSGSLPAPVTIDTPSAGEAAQPFAIMGWAVDYATPSGTGIDAVHVYAYPSDAAGTPTGAPRFLGAAGLGAWRADVATTFGNPGFATSGYGLTARGLRQGFYRIVVYARSTVTGDWSDAHRIVSVPRGDAMSLDIPSAGPVGQPFLLAGWAVDRAAASGTGVDAAHVYAYPLDASGRPIGAPLFLGAAAYGSARPDVGAVYGGQFVNSGYGLVVKGLSAGDYQLVVYTRSTVSGFWNVASRVVQVPPPAMALDSPSGGTVLQPFRLSGWAIDRAAASGTGVDAVHAYAFPADASGALTGAPPIFLGAAAYGGHRPDVGAIFGEQFTSSAYVRDITGLSAGYYQLVAYARSTVSGHWQNAARLIHVP